MADWPGANALQRSLTLQTGRRGARELVTFQRERTAVRRPSTRRATSGGFLPGWMIQLVVLCGIVGTAGCGTPAPPVFSDAQIASLAPVAKVQAAEFQERCRLTPNATNGELAGRILEVRGVVSMVGGVEGVGSYVMLVGGNKGANPVVCWMQEPELWSSVAPGMKVTVKGQFERLKERASYLDRPALPVVRQGVVVATEMPGAPLVDELAEEFCTRVHNDRDLLSRADDNWMWLTGNLVSIDPIQSIAFLSGGDSWVVVCRLAEGVKERVESGEFSVGGQVRVLGKFEQLGSRSLQLSGCLLAVARPQKQDGASGSGDREAFSESPLAPPAARLEPRIAVEAATHADQDTAPPPTAAVSLP